MPHSIHYKFHVFIVITLSFSNPVTFHILSYPVIHSYTNLAVNSFIIATTFITENYSSKLVQYLLMKQFQAVVLKQTPFLR